MIEFYNENIGISRTLYAIWSRKTWSYLQIFYRVHKMSVSVHVYSHRNFIVRYKDFTEISLTFVTSTNGSSFPVNWVREVDWFLGRTQIYIYAFGTILHVTYTKNHFMLNSTLDKTVLGWRFTMQQKQQQQQQQQQKRNLNDIFVF